MKPEHERLWERIQDRLDRREDPLDDPLIVSGLEENPEILDEVARLRARLREMAPSGRPEQIRPRAGRRRFALFALAAAALLLIAFLLVSPREPMPDFDPGSRTPPFDTVATVPMSGAEPFQVHAFSVVLETRSGDRVLTRRETRGPAGSTRVARSIELPGLGEGATPVLLVRFERRSHSSKETSLP